MDEAHHGLLAEVASMYYEREMTQNEIAKELDISRVKVYRLLKDAREKAVVRIIIDWPIKRNHALEAELQAQFGLREALVLQTSAQDARRSMQRLGQLGARYLEHILKDGPTMAICLGTTTYEVISAIHPDFQANVQVAQAIGSIPSTMQEYDSSALTRQLAQKLGGEAMYLASPLMADSAEAATVIRNQREVSHSLSVARAADIALVGIGDLDPVTSGFVKAGFITPAGIQDFVADGAVGDVAWQIFTESGALYPCDFNGRVIGITLDELRQIPTSIAVATGAAKARAILGVLRTEAINILCTDNQTAQLVLDLNTN